MDMLRAFLLSFYIMTLMTYGFWVNYTSFTLIIDVAGVLLFLYSIISRRGRIQINKECRTVYEEAAIFIIGILFVTLISWAKNIPLKMCILGSRDYYEFILLGLLTVNMIPNEESHDRFLRYITLFSVIMCTFGIFQFIFHSYLPDKLLHVRSGRLDYVYGLGNLIFRINGLYENSIVFNGIIIISSALTFGALLVKGKSFPRILGFVIAVVANILTFSRAAIIGSLMVYSVEYLILGKKVKIEKYIRIFAVGTGGILLFMTFASDTALYQRMFNSSITATSDIVHTTTIAQAIEAVSEHWVLGLGMGTQGYDSAGSTVSIIRDGCWLQFALELGIPLTLWVGVILLTLLSISMKRIKRVETESSRISCGVFVVITLYFSIVSFINSSFNAKEVFGLYWVLAGLMLWNPRIESPYRKPNSLLTFS